MSKDNEWEVNVKKTVPGDRKSVFEAWLEPEALATIMRPGPGIVSTARTDGREGGRFEIIMKAGEKELPHTGEYMEISRYEKLVFTWLSGFTRDDSVVTLTFEELGPNETAVHLHHVGFPSEESRSNHEGGWASILAALAERAEQKRKAG